VQDPPGRVAYPPAFARRDGRGALAGMRATRAGGVAAGSKKCPLLGKVPGPHVKRNGEG